MPDAVKKIWNLITWLLVTVVVALALLLAGGRLIGLRTFVVLSGSMEPLYPTGSLIYVKNIENTGSIPAGTVITYMISEDTVVTHRVVAAVPDGEDPTVVRYRTKGDANEAEDGTLVHYRNVIGTPVFTIPGLGYLANYIQNPPGSYVAMCLGALFVLMLFLPELLGAFLEKEERPRREKGYRREGPAFPPEERFEDWPYPVEEEYEACFFPDEDYDLGAEDTDAPEYYREAAFPAPEEPRPSRHAAGRRKKGGAHCAK